MADAKISALPALDAFASGDLFPVVDDPAGTPATKKATINQVQDYIEAAANTFTATQTLTPAVNTSALVGSGYSLTGSASASFMDLAGTWNTSGTPTLIKANVTDTASNASSLLMDLQVGGVSKFSVRKDGGFRITNPAGNGPFITYTAAARWSFDNIIGLNAGSGVVEARGFSLGSGLAAEDIFLTRRGPANLRLGAADTTGTTAPTPQFLSAQSWASSTNNNQPGATFTIDGSQGTGTGAGGSIVFRVAPAGGTANGVQNALATALTINPDSTLQLVGTSGYAAPPTIKFGASTAGIGYSIAGSYCSLHNGTTRAAVWGSGSNGFVSFATGIGFGQTPENADAYLYRDAGNTLALRNAGFAQEFRVYNTTDGTNSEFASLSWQRTTNRFSLGTTKVGTGTARELEIYAGDTGAQIYMTASGGTTFGKRGSSFFWSINGNTGHLEASDDNIRDIGAAAASRPRNVFIAGYNQLSEMTAPAAPATNGVRIYAEDNGSGKTRLMALFATGAAVQIAIEP